MFTSYNFPKLENCIDKQLSQIGNISLVGDRALRSFLARAPRLADPLGRWIEVALDHVTTTKQVFVPDHLSRQPLGPRQYVAFVPGQ